MLSLFLLVKQFALASRSQAREACRCGNGFGLQRTRPVEKQRRDTPAGFVVLPRKGQHSARLASPDCLPDNDDEQRCHPIAATVHVFPPSHCLGGGSSSNLAWPSVVCQDGEIAVVHKPEGVTSSGGKRRNDLQSTLPFS